MKSKKNRRRNNILDMTIHEQLEKIAEEMCDNYCKYVAEDYGGDLFKICDKCPLGRL